MSMLRRGFLGVMALLGVRDLSSARVHPSVSTLGNLVKLVDEQAKVIEEVGPNGPGAMTYGRVYQDTREWIFDHGTKVVSEPLEPGEVLDADPEFPMIISSIPCKGARTPLTGVLPFHLRDKLWIELVRWPAKPEVLESSEAKIAVSLILFDGEGWSRVEQGVYWANWRLMNT